MSIEQIPKLYIYSETRSLLLGEQLVIGGSGDLRLVDPRVSSRHARIALLDGAYTLEDLGSVEGTFLNDEKLSGPARLTAGDILRVGPFEMRFVLEDPASQGPPVHLTAGTPAPMGARIDED